MRRWLAGIQRIWRGWMTPRTPGAGWWVFVGLGLVLLAARFALATEGQADFVLLASVPAFILTGGLMCFAGWMARRVGEDEWRRRVFSPRGRVLTSVWLVLTIILGLVFVALLH